jgi:hypothetical protein
VAFNRLIKRIFHPRLWRLHHTKVLALLSNGSRSPLNLKDLGVIFPDLVVGFVTLLAWFISVGIKSLGSSGLPILSCLSLPICLFSFRFLFGHKLISARLCSLFFSFLIES